MLKSTASLLMAALMLLPGCEMLDTLDLQGPPPPENPVARASTLAGTSWRLKAVGGEAVPRAGAGATLTFSRSGTVAVGTGSCNIFGTNIALAEASLSFETVRATEQACLPPARMAQEDAYFRTLESVARFEATGTELILLGATGAELLRFEVAEMPLEGDTLIGTRWSLGNLEGTPVLGIAHIAFEQNGELSGQGPCNTFAGDYRLGEYNTVEIMPRKTTRCFCDGFDREDQFLSALRRVRDWRIDGERLVLGTQGATLMTLEHERMPAAPLPGC